MLSTLTLHVPTTALFILNSSLNLALLASQDCCFLNERFQCVVAKHCHSERLPVFSGIPQGTVLGPVLFILFIDDIGVICSGSLTHKLFADDMKLYSTIDTNLDNLHLIVYTDLLKNLSVYKCC